MQFGKKDNKILISILEPGKSVQIKFYCRCQLLYWRPEGDNM